MKRSILLAVVLIFAGALNVLAQPGIGQNKFCVSALPFCTGTVYNFPAGVNAGNGESGPCYSCLSSRHNPAWYYMKVLNPGDIIIEMHSEPSKDIDFCCWGPFNTQYCCEELTCNKVVDCSYSPLAHETVNIDNAQTGEYYMLVITNYSNDPCNIIFEQTGGNGTTDCSILPPSATNNSPICTGQTLLLNAQTVNNAIYSWTGPNGFASSLQNPTIPNAQPVNAGMYYLTISVNGQSSEDSSSTEVIVYQPMADAGNDTSILNGLTATLHGNCTGGSGSYHYHWEPAAKLTDPDVRTPQTVNLFATTVFTVSVTDDSASCQSNDQVTIDVIGGVLAVNAIASPSSICSGLNTQLQAFGSGGGGNYTYEWTGPNGFTSNLQNPTVQPAATSVYNVTVNDGYNTATGAVTVTVEPRPVADAGDNDTIPYGTYVFLSGTATGPGNSFLCSWEPANLLINANVQYPQTVNMTGSSVFSLTVTDLTTNCVSSNDANVSVVVTGGPLNVNPTAAPGWICMGDSTQLFASAGGGNTSGYQFSWTSNPPGFYSAAENPWVSPQTNTDYTVTVNDGFNLASEDAVVTIFPQAVVDLGPADSTVCIYDTITLDAGNPGSQYLWSNGATTRSIRVGTSGIGFDVQNYTVDVISPNGCRAEGAINLVFSFGGCAGIDDQKPGLCRIYPNPTKGKVTFEISEPGKDLTVTMVDILGRTVYSTVLSAANHALSQDVNLPPLPQGIYFVIISNSSTFETTKLLME